MQELSGASSPRAAEAVPGGGRRRPGKAFLAALGAAILAAAAYVAGSRAGHEQAPVFHRLTFRRGIVHAARFSPDLRTVVYSAAWQGGAPEVYSTRIDSIESRSLGLEGSSLAALSRGDELAILRGVEADSATYWSVLKGTLASVPLAGGSPRDQIQNVAFADFGLDGRTFAIVRGGNGKVLEFPPGRVLHKAEGWISEPRVDPGGSTVAFFEHPQRFLPAGRVCVVDAEGKARVLASGFLRVQGLAWSPDGREVWFTATRVGTARALYGVNLFGKERLIYRIPGALTLYDVSRDGRVLLAREEIRRETRGRSSEGAKELELSWLDYSNLINISADGSKVLFEEMGDGSGPTRKSYIRGLDGSPATLLAAGPDAYDLSRDGKWLLAFGDMASSHPKLLLIPTGPGEPRTIDTVPMEYQGVSLSADGKRLFLEAHPPGHRARIYVQEVSGGPPRPVTPEGLAFGNEDFGISGDGETIVVRNSDGEALLWTVRGGASRPIPGLDSKDEAVIGFSGSTALFVGPTRGLPRPIFRLDLTTGKREPILKLIPPDPAGVSEIDIVALNPDAGAYAYSYIRRSSDLYVVEGLK